MKTNKSTKERFVVKDGPRFKVEKKSITIRAGTIAKFKQKTAFGTPHYQMTKQQPIKKLGTPFNPLEKKSNGLLGTGVSQLESKQELTTGDTKMEANAQSTKHPSEAKYQQNKANKLARSYLVKKAVVQRRLRQHQVLTRLFFRRNKKSNTPLNNKLNNNQLRIKKHQSVLNQPMWQMRKLPGET